MKPQCLLAAVWVDSNFLLISFKNQRSADESWPFCFHGPWLSSHSTLTNGVNFHACCNGDSDDECCQGWLLYRRLNNDNRVAEEDGKMAPPLVASAALPPLHNTCEIKVGKMASWASARCYYFNVLYSCRACTKLATCSSLVLKQKAKYCMHILTESKTKENSALILGHRSTTGPDQISQLPEHGVLKQDVTPSLIEEDLFDVLNRSNHMLALHALLPRSSSVEVTRGKPTLGSWR